MDVFSNKSTSDSSSTVPVGGIVLVNSGFPTVGTNYLPCNGSDISNSSVPLLVSQLNPSVSQTLRGLPITGLWNSVAYGLGIYVVVGDTSSYLTSTDGVIWTSRTLPFAPAVSGSTNIAFGNGVFVVTQSGVNTQYGSTLWTSLNGLEWTGYAIPGSTVAYGDGSGYSAVVPDRVTFQNNLFLVTFYQMSGSNAGNNPILMTSPDGNNWTSRNPINIAVYDVSYGSSLYVYVGSSLVCTSPDTITWTSRTNISGTWRSIAFGNSIFVAVQNTSSSVAMSSTDGITWTSRTIPTGSYARVIFANGIFVAVGTNIVSTSTDGITWASRTVPSYSWKDVAYTPTLGFVSTANSSSVGIISTDGITWTPTVQGSPKNWSNVTYGPTYGYLAINGTTAGATSVDGITWSTATFPAIFVTIAYGAGLYVGTYGQYVYTSPDGVTWTSRGTFNTNSYTGVSLTYTGTYFIVVTLTGYSYFSVDGITWVQVLSISPSNLGIASGNGILVNVGNANSNAGLYSFSKVSASGISWTQYTGSIRGDANWSGIAFGKGVFVAISSSMRVLGPNNLYTGGAPSNVAAVSTDGIIWANSYLPVSATWTSIAYFNGIFVATCTEGSVIAISNDGFSWTTKSSSIPIPGYCIGVGSSNAVIPGYGNSVALRLTVSSSSVSLPKIAAPNGSAYVIRSK